MSIYTFQWIDERLMSMRFELTGQYAAVNLLICSPTEANPNTELKEVFWTELGHLAEQIAGKECMFVLVDGMV